MIQPAKLDALLRSVESKHGPFVLAGLFKREESPGRWDLVVSAPWLERGKLMALGQFVETLAATFGEEEVLSLSRIVTLNRADPSLKRILKELGTIRAPVERRGPSLFGLPLEHAYVFRAHRVASPSRVLQRARPAKAMPPH